MIRQETLDNGFIHTWSDDETKRIRNKANGDTFRDAIDNPAWGCEYEEVDKPEEMVFDKPEEMEVGNEQVS